MIHMYELVSI